MRLPATHRTAATHRIAATFRGAASHRVATPMLFASTDGIGFAANEDDTRSPGYLQTIAQSFGIGWTRITYNWQAIEQVQGTQVWTGFDNLTNEAIALGINVQGQIAFVPPWNSSDPNGGDGIAVKSHYAPSSYSAWITFVQTLVNRYPKVRHWEIWNEPDLLPMWQIASGAAPGNGQAPAYAQLLSQSYDAIKAIDSTLTVSFGGIARAGSSYDPLFFGSVLTDATYPCANKFDRANFHDYNLSTMTANYSYVAGQLTSAGRSGVPIDCGEVGYFSDPREQDSGSGFSGYQYGPPAQIAWIQAAHSTLYGAGVARVFWFSCYDSLVNNSQVGNGTYGLLDSTGDIKVTL